VLSNGNTIVVTDKVRCNSVTIPQPVTKILQINSPGPQGPPGPGGGGGGGSAGSNATASFTLKPTWVFNHNLGQKFVVIQTFDTNYNEIIPQNVQLVNSSSATITFPTSESGYAVASLGGLGNTLSASYASTSSYSFYAVTASYALNGGGGGSGAGFPYNGNAIISGSLLVSGSGIVVTGSIRATGGFQGTASYAYQSLSSSYAAVASRAISASYASSSTYTLTASYALNSLQSVTASYVLTASYAATSSLQLPILDEGNQIVPYPTTINFAGDGIYTSRTNNDVTVFVPGVLGGISAVLSANQPLTGSKNINVPNTSSFFIKTDNYPSGTFFISSSLVRLGDWSGSVSNSFVEINDASNYIKIKANNISITGSVAISGSLSATSSWAINAITSSYAQTLAIQTTLTAYTSSTTIAGVNTLFTQATSSYNSAFGKYTVLSGSNARAGEFMTVWTSGSITYTDFATTDIGSTFKVAFSSSFSGANILLQASASAGWIIKMLTTFI
jgi:hypothetical protein